MRIVIGSDHRGRSIQSEIIDFIISHGHEIVDVGSNTNDLIDYPDIAASVANEVSKGKADRGILVGGTGLGMCVAANKFPGVRAAPCLDDFTAEMSRRHNDLNVLCLSAELLNAALLQRIVEVWLKTPSENGHHTRRIKKIAALEHDRDQRILADSLAAHQCDLALLACELHDGLAQKLAGALMQLQAITREQDWPSGKSKESLHTVMQLLDDSIAEVRRLLTGLRPPMLDGVGLVAAIESVIRLAQQSEGPKIEFVHSGQIDPLFTLLETCVFRIVQEGLANACRHSQSPKVRIFIRGDAENVQVEIRDWGVGFDLQQVAEKCFGLRAIRERANALGGAAVIESIPGKGTRIIVVLPRVLVETKDTDIH